MSMDVRDSTECAKIDGSRVSDTAHKIFLK